MKASEYFNIIGELPDEATARAALASGRVQFVLKFRGILPGSCCAANARHF
jgi:hypothetical protein